MTMEERFWAKVDKTGNCWVWTAARLYSGYGQFKLRSYVKDCAHRVSYEMHYGAIPEGMFVCHRCDNPSCVNPDHLFLGTPQDNMDDMVAKGRQGKSKIHRGESNVTAKLKWSEVEEIRHSASPYRELAQKFGVSLSQIGRIKKGQSWKVAA